MAAMHFHRLLACALAGVTPLAVAQMSMLHEERDGVIRGEAEHFAQQEKDGVRRWYVQSAAQVATVEPDGDPSHYGSAGNGAYVEALPDTRRTHADKLVAGENFSNTPGEMAVLSYRIRVKTPGRYFVWVRAFSTGTEDNGIHVGLNGEWPASGARMQWCKSKQRWRWESAQRTQESHCGEPGKIFLNIERAGEHTLQFSLREDGFEFDQWLLTQDPAFRRPPDGPETEAP
jgi:hypothetical protein